MGIWIPLNRQGSEVLSYFPKIAQEQSQHLPMPLVQVLNAFYYIPGRPADTELQPRVFSSRFIYQNLKDAWFWGRHYWRHKKHVTLVHNRIVPSCIYLARRLAWSQGGSSVGICSACGQMSSKVGHQELVAWSLGSGWMSKAARISFSISLLFLAWKTLSITPAGTIASCLSQRTAE